MLTPLRAFFKSCPHDHIRCVDGDEINQTARMFRRPEIARAACTDCGRYLYNVEPPYICTTTGEPHWNTDSRRTRHLKKEGDA